MSVLPHLAITLGDPAGIGPEIILKALADASVAENCQITIIGSRLLLEATYKHLRNNLNLAQDSLVNPQQLEIIDVFDRHREINCGQGTSTTGEASFAYLEEAIELTLAGKFQGIVTAPIAKSLWQAAGHNYPGQTEVLAQKAGVTKFGMLFVARSPYTGWTLRTLLATTHIPLAEVAKTLNPELMSRKLNLLIDCLNQDFGIKQPKIAIAGLNPHSGEEGKLGTEEQEWLNDWLQQEQRQHPQAKLMGLIPPDTMWVKPGQAWYSKEFDRNQSDAADAYLALYHDQGLIPVKLMAFEQAVNTTIGLPFIRTSPDHGTAFDIAGKGLANPNSMKAAIKLAAELTRIRINCS
jgi:4-hydroxythreonine-4-phosphate dehydrogenase